VLRGCGLDHRPPTTRPPEHADAHPVALTGADFDRHIAKSELPVVVDFWAPWCGPCRTMAPVFERAAKELESAFRFVKVNTDDEQAIAARHGIRGIPTLAIFRKGVEVARTSGAMDATRLVAWVRQNA
jgi:thioredoxin 2